jgi:hypothetical protein
MILPQLGGLLKPALAGSAANFSNLKTFKTKHY